MERGSLAKWLLPLLGAFLLFQFGGTWFCGGGGSAKKQPLTVHDQNAPAERAPEATCALAGRRFEAELSTRGASLRHARMLDPKYHDAETPGAQSELVTTSRESRMPLRTDLVPPGAENQQVPFNDLDWKLEASSPTSCTFVHESEQTRLVKVVEVADKPFSLRVKLTVENLAKEPKKHRLAIEQTAWRTVKETEGSLGTISEKQTDVAAATDQEVERLGPGDFDPDDFDDERFTPEAWRRTPGAARWIAVSSSYFTNLLVPVAQTDGLPSAETQIEQYASGNDPNYGHVYRARLAYPPAELAPGASATYEVLSYTGPKERDLLAAIGDGTIAAGTTVDVINLGWFSPIAKQLVRYIVWLHKLVGSWGWSIVLLTISVRILLLPLTYFQVKSGIAMRRLKPEMDAITAKYKDDQVQRTLATQELWRKNKLANPAAGCLPALVQIPVWWALYTALQTAVELYHTPFGPFIPDLAAPGKYFIIPIVLGASSFLQQKLMPMQGDPMQQKMMLYMMPAVFTFMMLFLPAGLGVYMLTNTWLGIGQQLVVNAASPEPKRIEVREKTSGGSQGAKPQSGGAAIVKAQKAGAPPGSALGKGKSRGRA